MLGEMLRVLPTRPVIYVVPTIVIVVMSLYYWNLYSDCTQDRQERMELSRILASDDRTEPFRLVEFTEFAWDQIRIIENFRPERRTIQCPFGWNWPAGVRESLIESGQLTVLVFGWQGSIVEYLELPGNEIVFGDPGGSLAPDNAVFDVTRTGSGEFLLKAVR